MTQMRVRYLIEKSNRKAKCWRNGLVFALREGGVAHRLSWSRGDVGCLSRKQRVKAATTSPTA
jgi:hypothetical protein